MSLDGGSKMFEVHQDTKERIEESIRDTDSEVQSSNGDVSGQSVVSEMLVEASVKIIGKTLELLTRIPEMDFDDDEIEQLKTVWSPMLPDVSPLAAALVVTTAIIGGKVVIYRQLRHGKPDRTTKFASEEAFEDEKGGGIENSESEK
ncbi:MAG: hypothetical protein ABIH76_01540 [Candidatus Bathyarchaeota archaeon]